MRSKEERELSAGEASLIAFEMEITSLLVTGVPSSLNYNSIRASLATLG